MARRDTLQKIAVKEEEIIKAVETLLEEIQGNMYSRAKENLAEKIATANDYYAFVKTLNEKGGFIKAGWCGNTECEEKIKESTGATIRLRPFEKEEPIISCVFCRKKAQETVYFARSY